jgi:hypothetical protein
MGLAICTNMLADLMQGDPEGADWMRKQLVVVNELLSENGLPPHDEPLSFGAIAARAHAGSFPYSFLHYLRRAFAHVREEVALAPVADGEDPAADPLIDDVASMMDSHLICHSDAEGFYVPLDFSEVIFELDGQRLPGGMLGSSQRLLAELVEVAPALAIPLDGGELSDIEAARLATVYDESSGPYWRERLVWLALYEGARVSIANKTMLVFH